MAALLRSAELGQCLRKNRLLRRAEMLERQSRSVVAAFVVFAFLVGAAFDGAIAMGNLELSGWLLHIGAGFADRAFMGIDVDPLGLNLSVDLRLLLLPGLAALANIAVWHDRKLLFCDGWG
jgi:hypothetical protein